MKRIAMIIALAFVVIFTPTLLLVSEASTSEVYCRITTCHATSGQVVELPVCRWDVGIFSVEFSKQGDMWAVDFEGRPVGLPLIDGTGAVLSFVYLELLRPMDTKYKWKICYQSHPLAPWRLRR